MRLTMAPNRVQWWRVSVFVVLALVRLACTLDSPSRNCTGTADAGCLAKLSLLASKNAGDFCTDFDEFASQVLMCANVPDRIRPLKVLAPDQIKSIMPALLQTFKAQTGFDVLVDYVPLDTLASKVLDTDASGKEMWDAWMIDPVGTVDMVQRDMVQELGSYIAADPGVDWLGVERYFRLVSSVYNGSVVGIPLGGKISTLFYRKDVLSRVGLPPPNTWEELVWMASRLNGTDFNADNVTDHAICVQIFDGCLEDYALFGQILASMTQSLGLQSGWLFDPDTMTPLIDSKATLKAISLLQDMLKYTNPKPGCSLFNYPFLSGSCVFTIKWDEQFKGLQYMDKLLGLRKNPWKGGSIGYAQLPGSAEVLDRTTGELVPCTIATCPFATPSTSLINNAPMLINRAPYSGISGLAGMVSKGSAPSFRQAAYDLFSFLARWNISYPLVIGLTPVGPFLTQHLDTSLDSLHLWQAQGYDPSDVTAFLSNMQTSLGSPNLALDLRITNSYKFRTLIKQGVTAAINGTRPAEVVKELSSAFNNLLNVTNPKLLWTGYWAALNLRKSWAEVPPFSFEPPPPKWANKTSDGMSNGILAAIIVPVVIVGVAILVGIVMWVRALKGSWIRFGRSPPLVGPSTTILVTDIENSTLLWESTSQDVMNSSVEIHHDLVRKLLRQHHGYESATEGDSFIVAFHHPDEALGFAQNFQASLLKQNWAPELLESQYAVCQWAMKAGSVNITTASAPKSSMFAKSSLRLHGSGTLFSPPSMLSVVQEATSPTAQIATEHNAVTLSRPSFMVSQTEGGAGQVPTLLENIFSARAREDPSSIDGSQSVLQFFKSQWVPCPPPADGKSSPATVLIHRGLRVRVGMHTGISDPQDAVLNKTTNRIQYSGQPLALAKAVADCGHGGMVLMSQASFEGLSPLIVNKFMMLSMGDYTFLKDLGLPLTALFQAVPLGIEYRLAFFPDLRSVNMMLNGCLEAPLGDVSICFVNMVGASSLLAWNREVAEHALATYQGYAMELLSGHQRRAKAEGAGSSCYLVELAGGLCLAAFTSPATALVWALSLVQRMKSSQWDEELLSHELCEPVMVGMSDTSFNTHTPGQASGPVPTTDELETQDDNGNRLSKSSMLRQPRKAQVLFCGPRLKCGIDTGRVHANVNPTTGRMAYRGRVMNRSARIAEKAGSGQVWCSDNAWATALEMDAAELAVQHVEVHQLGPFVLKGVNEPLRLLHATMPQQTRTRRPNTFGDVPPSPVMDPNLLLTRGDSDHKSSPLLRPAFAPTASDLVTASALSTHSFDRNFSSFDKRSLQLQMMQARTSESDKRGSGNTPSINDLAPTTDGSNADPPLMWHNMIRYSSEHLAHSSDAQTSVAVDRSDTMVDEVQVMLIAAPALRAPRVHFPEIAVRVAEDARVLYQESLMTPTTTVTTAASSPAISRRLVGQISDTRRSAKDRQSRANSEAANGLLSCTSARTDRTSGQDSQRASNSSTQRNAWSDWNGSATPSPSTFTPAAAAPAALTSSGPSGHVSARHRLSNPGLPGLPAIPPSIPRFPLAPLEQDRDTNASRISQLTATASNMDTSSGLFERTSQGVKWGLQVAGASGQHGAPVRASNQVHTRAAQPIMRTSTNGLATPPPPDATSPRASNLWSSSLMRVRTMLRGQSAESVTVTSGNMTTSSSILGRALAIEEEPEEDGATFNGMRLG